MKKKEHKRCGIREERCDKNVIGKENNNIKMKRWKRKNIRDEILEYKKWNVHGKEVRRMCDTYVRDLKMLKLKP